MTRLNKYMVFNPKADKPKKFFSYREKAMKVARYMRNKYKTDFLVLKVDYIAQYEPTAKEKLEEIKEQTEKRCKQCSLKNNSDSSDYCPNCFATRIKQIIGEF